MSSDETKSEFADYRPPLSNEQFKRLDPILDSIAGSFARCEADRLDYKQEAMLRLWESKTWTNPFACAYWGMLDYHKKMKRWRNEPSFAMGGEGELDTSDGRPDPFEVLLGVDQSNFDGLDLNEKERQTAILYWVHGLSQTEVAEKTGYSQMGVSKALDRIRGKFREKWLPEEEEE